MENKNKQFDSAVNARLNKEELPFDPMAWEMMEEKLDNKSSGLIFWKNKKTLLLGVAIILLMIPLFYWSNYNHEALVGNNAGPESTKKVESLVTTDLKTEVESHNTNAVNEIIAKEEVQKIEEVAHTDPSIKKAISKSNRNSDAKSQVITAISGNSSKGLVQTNESTKTISPQLNAVVENNPIPKTNSTKNSRFAQLVKSKTEIKAPSLMENFDALAHKTSQLEFFRAFNLYPTQIEVQKNIDRPKHQINFAIGSGKTRLDVDAPHTGDVTPIALSSNETFFSMSYLYRAFPNWGFELGAQASYQTHKIGHYFQAGDYNLPNPTYGTADIGAYEGKYDFFANVHFFLPLDQRSELDFYAGYYAHNPLSPPGGSWGSGFSRPIPGNNDVTLIRTFTEGDSGPFQGGRLKLGLNYNFLTNKKNTVGFGISYMHELHKSVEGTYELIKTNDFVEVAGNLRTNSSGFKVQFNYGFGLDFKSRKKKLNKQNNDLKNPWYFGYAFGRKSYVFSDDLSKELISPNTQDFYHFFVGHYIKPKLAFEVGLDLSEFVFSTPTELVANPSQYVVQKHEFRSVNFALRYDVLATDRVSLYSKALFSTDFRSSQFNAYFDLADITGTGYITDNNKLNLNAGLETGVDFRLFKGVHLGARGTYNHAFNDLAKYQYPIINSENENAFEEITLKNTYLSWGLELKYKFNSI